jgi:hypothetical protein
VPKVPTPTPPPLAHCACIDHCAQEHIKQRAHADFELRSVKYKAADCIKELKRDKSRVMNALKVVHEADRDTQRAANRAILTSRRVLEAAAAAPGSLEAELLAVSQHKAEARLVESSQAVRAANNMACRVMHGEVASRDSLLL